MRTLILNSSNIVKNSGNGIFEYKFPAGAIVIKQGQKLALASLQTYYSNFNITDRYDNNKFSYIWIDGSVVNIVIPDSFLDVNGINNYLHFIMIQNKHYYLTSGGDFVYLLTISINPSQYAVEINSFQTSVSIASSNSWSIPVGATWVNPTNPINPSITIINNFGLLLGFAPATYPSGVISGVPPSQIQTPSYSSTQIFLSSIVSVAVLMVTELPWTVKSPATVKLLIIAVFETTKLEVVTLVEIKSFNPLMRPPAPAPKVTLPATVKSFAVILFTTTLPATVKAFADILFTTTLPPVIVPVAIRLPKNPA